ncbi:hypothetical protein CS053_00465 [Rhodanobacter glycinis]|uniref:Uncharacterized protein n=1 Tax=Rhodanobacter glycinis TaxID=582702 RepID=A0A5B9DYQ4_9GAMM|nr:hypothetical protein [Rhodanobacter glycinis]QEE23137.1 hypothetical protein CS053_00465 [Rhodanobacter glycinis]
MAEAPWKRGTELAARPSQNLRLPEIECLSPLPLTATPPSPSFQRKLESSAFGFFLTWPVKVAGFQLSLE